MPKSRAVQQARAMSKKALAEDFWAAQVNSDSAMECAAEAWARLAEAAEMLEGKRPVDMHFIELINQHTAHVVQCRTGSCEHDYAALVRAELGPAPAKEIP